MEIFSPLHILLIVGIALLLFGPSKFAALGKGVGEGIRKILLTSETIHLTTASELLLFFASRSQNIQEMIKPALDRGD